MFANVRSTHTIFALVFFICVRYSQWQKGLDYYCEENMGPHSLSVLCTHRVFFLELRGDGSVTLPLLRFQEFLPSRGPRIQQAECKNKIKTTLLPFHGEIGTFCCSDLKKNPFIGSQWLCRCVCFDYFFFISLFNSSKDQIITSLLPESTIEEKYRTERIRWNNKDARKFQFSMTV